MERCTHRLTYSFPPVRHRASHPACDKHRHDCFTRNVSAKAHLVRRKTSDEAKQVHVNLQRCVNERKTKVYFDAESTLTEKGVVHNVSFYFLCDPNKWVCTTLILEIFQDGLDRLDSWIFALVCSVLSTHETLLSRLDLGNSLGHIAWSTNLLHIGPLSAASKCRGP